MKWAPEGDVPLIIPAAVPVVSDISADDLTADVLGNLAYPGELSLTYAIKLLSGFDVFEMPISDAASEPVARIVFTVDLTGLVHERF